MGPLFNFFEAKKCPFLHLPDTALSFYNTPEGSNFLGGSFSYSDNVKTPIQFRRQVNPNILKDDFSSRTDPPTIFK